MREFYSIEDRDGERWVYYRGFTWARDDGELPYSLTEGTFCMCSIAEVVGDSHEHMAQLVRDSPTVPDRHGRRLLQVDRVTLLQRGVCRGRVEHVACGLRDTVRVLSLRCIGGVR